LTDRTSIHPMILIIIIKLVVHEYWGLHLRNLKSEGAIRIYVTQIIVP
jgi:hypothetical protein